MSLRLRFALLFTIAVAIILLLSATAIFYFYGTHRQAEFENKLRSEALVLSEDYLEKDFGTKDVSLNIIKKQFNDFLYEKIAIIYSSNCTQVYTNPNAATLSVSSKIFAKIKKQKDYYFNIKQREFVGIYLENNDKYVVISAIDTDGLNKLHQLNLILFIVFFVGVLATTGFSYFFVSSALQPLLNLSNQINETSENNLWKKVNEGNGKDEIAQIAINYNNMMQRLKIAFEVQKNFVHHASHELRTPLTVMSATTEAALHKNLTKEEFKTVLVSLKDDQNNLIELTNSLLLLSQFEKLQYSPNLQTIRIDEVIYDAISYSKKNFPTVIIDFSFLYVPEEKDLLILGNANLLKAAFTNLIKNAFLYSSDKKLFISLIALDKKMEIDFENKGAYLTEPEVKNIENPFSRGDNIGLSKGIGLGLSIVQKIISLHNGNLIYLPLANGINRFTVKLK